MMLILGTIAIAAFIILLDDIRRALVDTYTIVAVFPEARALDRGTPVWIAGRPVGEVERVEMLPASPAGRNAFAATLRIPTTHAPLIRRDSEIRFTTPRLLADPVADLMPGSAASPVLAPGDTLFARKPLTLRQIAAAADTVRRSLDTLAAATRALEARARARAPAAERAIAALDAAGAEIDALAAAYERGPLAAFLADTSTDAALARIRAAADEIATRAHARLARARDPALAASIRRVQQRAATLRAQVDTLRAMLDPPRGFLVRWEKDPALRDAFAAVQAQVDSLVAEARRQPWRWIF
ncbi:MAG TPA: MCE family protein [Longimicrobiales bacterium]